MRTLNPKQKKILDAAFNQNRSKFCLSFHVLDMEHTALMQSLEEIHNYERLWMDANRYISDKVADWLYKKA